MALSSDYVIRVAPGISAKAAGADASLVADRALVLSLIVGGVALTLTYLAIRKQIVAPSAANLEAWESLEVPEAVSSHQHGAAPAASRHLPAGGHTHAQAAGSTSHSHGGTTTALLLDAPDQDADTRVGPAPGWEGSGNGQPATVGRTAVCTQCQHPDAVHQLGAHGGQRGCIESGCGCADFGQVHGHMPGHARESAPATGAEREEPITSRASSVMAAVVPATFALLVIYMIIAKFSDAIPDTLGDDAVALVGGVALLLMIIAVVAAGLKRSLETAAAHLGEGFTFAFRVLGGILPIAGFFLLGSAAFSAPILGLPVDQAPSFLTDLVGAAQGALPQNSFVSAFGVLFTGMVAGLEGSGFAGLPLTGALAGSLGPVTNMDPATLAAIGQMGSVWFAGTVVAWSGHVVIAAGFARVETFSVIRQAMVPVLLGLVLATVVAVVVFG